VKTAAELLYLRLARIEKNLLKQYTGTRLQMDSDSGIAVLSMSAAYPQGFRLNYQCGEAVCLVQMSALELLGVAQGLRAFKAKMQRDNDLMLHSLDGAIACLDALKLEEDKDEEVE